MVVPSPVVLTVPVSRYSWSAFRGLRACSARASGVRRLARIASTVASCSGVRLGRRGMRTWSVAMTSASIFRDRIGRFGDDYYLVWVILEAEDDRNVLACRGPSEHDRVAGFVARFEFAFRIAENFLDFLLGYFAVSDDVPEVPLRVVFGISTMRSMYIVVEPSHASSLTMAVVAT